MAFLDSLNISGSGLTAQKFRMNIISQNIANAETTRTANGSPYQRKLVVFSENTGSKSFGSVLGKTASSSGSAPAGVNVESVIDDTEPFKLEYDPTNPDAGADGYVRLPNVNTVTEMVDMLSATRSYEANISAFNAVKLMATKALDIGK